MVKIRAKAVTSQVCHSDVARRRLNRTAAGFSSDSIRKRVSERAINPYIKTKPNNINRVIVSGGLSAMIIPATSAKLPR